MMLQALVAYAEREGLGDLDFETLPSGAELPGRVEMLLAHKPVDGSRDHWFAVDDGFLPPDRQQDRPASRLHRERLPGNTFAAPPQSTRPPLLTRTIPLPVQTTPHTFPSAVITGPPLMPCSLG